jgi:hypothetical protein
MRIEVRNIFYLLNKPQFIFTALGGIPIADLFDYNINKANRKKFRLKEGLRIENYFKIAD